MPRSRSWKELLPGVIALCTLAAAGTAVLVFGGVNAMHGSTVTLYGTASDATGLIKGSEVWLVGQKIGLVRDVGFRNASADTSERTIVTLEILDEPLQFIRQGATIDIHPGGNFIGAPVVSIAQGAAGAPPIRDGDTLRSEPGRRLDRARADFATATQGVPLLVSNLRLLGSQLRSARGTLGAFGIGGGPELGSIAASANQLLSSARAGRGTVGLAMGGGEARRRAGEAMAGIDSIRAVLMSPDAPGPIGRFRRDSTLPAVIASIQSDLAAVARLLDEPRGTAGRLQGDSALAQEVARGRAELAALAADVKRNPLRYIAF